MVSSVVSANVERLRALLQTPAVRLVLENFLSLSSIHVLGQLAMLVLVPFVTRKLGIEKFGITSFGISFVMIFQFVTVYGFNNSASRKAALHKHDHSYIQRLYSSVSVAKLLLCILAAIAYFTFIFTTPQQQFAAYKGLYAVLFLYVIGESLFPMWLLMGLEEMRFLGILNFISRIAMVIATLLCINSPDDYVLYAGFTTISFLINGILGSGLVLFKLKIRPTMPQFDEIKEVFREGLPVFLSLVSIYTYTSCRIIILGLFADENTIGQYAVGERISNALQIFPVSALITALLPRLTSMYNNDKTRTIHLMKKVQKAILFYGLVLSVPVLFFAPDMITIIANYPYTISIETLRILFVSTIFVLANTVRVQLFIIAGDFKTFSKIHIVWSIIGLLSVTYFTSVYSYSGLAWSISALEACILITTIIVQRLRGESI
ncbi:MAG TPA: oligosaccharide flippase family protein [Candidatus Kapabacteria bacterium]|jgi:PST family polysaccharide transporter|nr:oligosaccharide flippase family protein [Ignavibacteria bacterium]HRE58355.1 oligosaccharide flippase family protein [Candidatus Kapabacteria bacterium]